MIHTTQEYSKTIHNALLKTGLLPLHCPNHSNQNTALSSEGGACCCGLSPPIPQFKNLTTPQSDIFSETANPELSLKTISVSEPQELFRR